MLNEEIQALIDHLDELYEGEETLDPVRKAIIDQLQAELAGAHINTRVTTRAAFIGAALTLSALRQGLGMSMDPDLAAKHAAEALFVVMQRHEGGQQP